MARKRKGNPVHGWVNLDKPAGMTSTQAMAKVRYLLQAEKAGHGGTLDPLATGVLPIALGEATKTIPFCQDCFKAYSFRIHWGEERDTDDAEGQVIATSDVRPTRAQIEAVLPRFTGDIIQTPPRFSAIKIGGERAYDLARAGEEVEPAPRAAYIEAIDIIEENDGTLGFKVVCGKGTYMRSLGRDMARALGTAGHIRDLRRLAVGGLEVEDAISLEKLEALAHSARLEEALLPLQTMLDDIPALAVNQREAAWLKQGQTLTFMARPDVERLTRAGIDLTAGDSPALAFYEGRPVAIVNVNGPQVHPQRVLNL